jgi:hypothetical protein
LPISAVIVVIIVVAFIAFIATTGGCTDASNVTCILIGKVNEDGPGEENSLRAV